MSGNTKPAIFFVPILQMRKLKQMDIKELGKFMKLVRVAELRIHLGHDSGAGVLLLHSSTFPECVKYDQAVFLSEMSHTSLGLKTLIPM